MFEAIKRTLGEHGDTHVQILTQVKTTNGRVTSLERWMDRTIGGMAVLTFLIVPILGWALYRLANLDQLIHSSVDDALSAYEVQQ